MSVNEKFRDKAEREIFAAAMEARNRQCPWDSPDEVASRAWAMVKAYRSRCPANDGGPTESADVEAAWKWLVASAGWQWASADEAAGDAGPTAETIMGEAISAGLGRSPEDWETMPAVEPDAGPTGADLRGEVEHGG